jgi:hypothetical protein
MNREDFFLTIHDSPISRDGFLPDFKSTDQNHTLTLLDQIPMQIENLKAL